MSVLIACSYEVGAQPWRMAASVLLLAVGVLVAAVVVWTITNTAMGDYYVIYGETLAVIGEFDTRDDFIAYSQHPAHTDIIFPVCGPVMSGYSTAQFEI